MPRRKRSHYVKPRDFDLEIASERVKTLSAVLTSHYKRRNTIANIQTATSVALALCSCVGVFVIAERATIADTRNLLRAYGYYIGALSETFGPRA